METETEITTKRINKPNWIIDYWRHAMGWVYMAICICDFIIFPILWSYFQYNIKSQLTPWSPLTLQAGGLLHFSMCGVLGITSFSKSKEKISGL